MNTNRNPTEHKMNSFTQMHNDYLDPDKHDSQIRGIFVVVREDCPDRIFYKGSHEECCGYLRSLGRKWQWYDMRRVNSDGTLGRMSSFVL